MTRLSTVLHDELISSCIETNHSQMDLDNISQYHLFITVSLLVNQNISCRTWLNKFNSSDIEVPFLDI